MAQPLTPDDCTVLVADDDAVTRRLLEKRLQAGGYKTILVDDGERAIGKLSADIAVAIVDLQMPKKSGMECLRHAREHFPDVPVLVMSQFGEIADAVEAIKRGAVDYFTKPIDDADGFLARVRHAASSNRLATENRQLREAIASPMVELPTFATAPTSKRLAEMIERVAALDATVLLTGESGTGKTTLARKIHHAGTRAKGPFVAVSCASIPRDLLESELFGHVRGAFTSAVADRPGRAEMADGGTLFLDEIGDMPLELQPKLLTFLQDRTIQRIGATRERKVDVRVIAATNRDLETMCRDGQFRQDLFFRLNVLPIDAPPLRERRNDLPDFVAYIAQKIARQRSVGVYAIDDDARIALLQHSWPGNIRELENVLERATAFCAGNRVTRNDLLLRPTSATASSTAAGLAGSTLEDIERRAIVETLAHCNGNKKAAAKMLAIDEKSIYNKMKRLGIDP